jgi:hypothetical protein
MTTPNEEPRRLSFRTATKPLTDYFDRRFADLHEHLDRVEARLDRLEALVGGLDGAQKVEAAAVKAERFDDLSTRLERFANEFAARAERIAAAYEATRPRDGA